MSVRIEDTQTLKPANNHRKPLDSEGKPTNAQKLKDLGPTY